MRFFYSLALHLLSPLMLLRLFWKSRRQPAYRKHLAERWGFYEKAPDVPRLWLHAVSVGETRAAQPLVEALSSAFPGHALLLTTTTPTGREAARQVFGESLSLVYLPYDTPGAVRRFFRHFRPVLGVLMETEIWPNLLTAAQAENLPVILANARLSKASAAGYRRFDALARPAFAALAGVAAQTEADAARLRQAGATRVAVCGNLKFDVPPDAALLALGKSWRRTLGPRSVWLAASTREGEESLILDALAAAPWPEDALIVIVPRHPQRFDEVAARIQERGFPLARRSAALPSPLTRVWLGDSMGEMPAYYALADLAYVGGSLLPLGGQNLIEAAASACPVLVGPHTFNFAQATEDALAAGAAMRVAQADELLRTSQELLAQPERLAAMARAALDFAAAHAGATRHTLALIQEAGKRVKPPLGSA